MARYALVKNGIVENVIILDADHLVFLDEDSQVGKQDIYDPAKKKFSKDPLVLARDKAAAEAREAELAKVE